MFFFFNDTATTEIYTLSLHDALPISICGPLASDPPRRSALDRLAGWRRSEEHTSELQSQSNLVCRLLLEKKKKLRRQPTILSREERRNFWVADFPMLCSLTLVILQLS